MGRETARVLVGGAVRGGKSELFFGMTQPHPKVLLAMSGGVDSSVAAALLQRAGYEVVGVFMRLGSPGETFDELRPYDSVGVACDPAKIKIGHQGCCSINDANDAREVAAVLGIPLYVVNFKKDFARIIDYFVDAYANGQTPNPCVRCNDWLKFGKLHDYARQIGAAYVASGHYARVANAETARMLGAWEHEGITLDNASHALPPRLSPDDGSGPPALLRGVDHAKDQSYLLFGASTTRLSEMLLPVGHFTKPAIREFARRLDLPVFNKPDSQEICFVPDNDYAGLVERRSPSLRQAGEIRDTSGKTVGTHDGHHHFTIGQRRGVGVALGYPIYVVDKDPRTNSITVGTKEHLRVSGCGVAEANWLVPKPAVGTRALARYRAHGEEVVVRIREHTEAGRDAGPAEARTPSGRSGRFAVEFEEPQFGVAPGQAIVLYDIDEPDIVLGGGWIDSTARELPQRAVTERADASSA